MGFQTLTSGPAVGQASLEDRGQGTGVASPREFLSPQDFSYHRQGVQERWTPEGRGAPGYWAAFCGQGPDRLLGSPPS